MIHSPKFTAVLDACVLYPVPIRDLLLNLADFELYKPKWTQKIQQEWLRNLLANRVDLKVEQLNRTIEAMNRAFPDANVENFESLIESFYLPDPKDRHVVAAAVRVNADVIVTANLKDFPADYLAGFDIEVQHPDEFIYNLIDLNPAKAQQAFKNQVASLKNPPKTKEEVLENLKKCGLIRSSELLKK